MASTSAATDRGTRSRLVVVLLLSLACACARPAGPSTNDLARFDRDAAEALRRGDFDAALATSERGFQASTPGSVDALRFRLLEAEVHLFRRNAEGASALLETPLPAGTPDQVIARREYLAGQLRVVRGAMAEALPLLDAARQRADRAGAADVSLDARILRGQVLLRLGQREEATALLAAALADADRRNDRVRAAVASHNLGMGQLIGNSFDAALPHFTRVLSDRGLADYTVYATALTNAALCYARLGEFNRAIELQRQAVAIHERRGAPVYLEQALGELGSTYALGGDVDQSITYLQRALDVAQQVGQQADASLWAANLAALHIDRSQWDEAARYNALARTLRTDARNAPYRIIYDAQIAEGRGHYDEARRLYAEARASGADDPAIEWQVHEGLGAIALAEKNGRGAPASFEAALGVVERTRSELLKADYRLSIQTRLIRLYRGYVDALIAQGQTDRALSVADSSRARVLAERQGQSAPRRVAPAVFTQAARHLDATLLFYWITDRQSYAWVVRHSSIAMVPLPASARGPELEALVRRHHQQVVEAIGDPRSGRASPGDALYTALVAPLAPALGRPARVVIVPDGPLATLNFETLPVREPAPHFWISDVEVIVAPSLASLTTPAAARSAAPTPPVRQSAGRPVRQSASAPARPAANRALVIGDAATPDPDFPALRYAGAEMSAVSKAFPGRASVLRGAQASPQGYRDAMPERFGVVHFTAHAQSNAESPLDSAVLLSKDASGYKLYARDVAEQPLSAELVTISACRSAGETAYSGEGLVGFAWAFMRAGARRVIAGLWDVDDKSTADLMERLYAQIADGQSPAAALRAAKLALIARGGASAKPYYWGPFQLFVGSNVRP